MTKPVDTLKTIARYIEAKKPKTLGEAEHMLDLISVIADETIREAEIIDPLATRFYPRKLGCRRPLASPTREL
jgi:hypothetical protein